MDTTATGSTINWTAIEFASGFLFIFLALYFAIPRSIRQFTRKRWSAAPTVPSSQIGGVSWWPVWAKPLPLMVIAIYLGEVCFSVHKFAWTAAAIFWWASSLVIAGFFWLWPLYRKWGRLLEENRSQRQQKYASPTRFPGEDEADFRVVSPYDDLGSGDGPWWRRRKKPKDGALT